MKKKWICTVCGYVHEGDEAPYSVRNVNNRKASSRNWWKQPVLCSL